MIAAVRNPLTLCWLVLSAVTLVSWLAARDTAAAPVLDATVTVLVLVIAAVKSQLVIWYFMEVRHAPSWLKAATAAWVGVLFALLIGLYFVGLPG